MARRKSKKKSSKGVVWFVLLVCAAFIGYGPLNNALKSGNIRLDRLPQLLNENLSQNSTTQPSSTVTDAQGLELPAPLKNVSETILKRKGYTVSYNSRLNVPNWVAWELNRDKLVERESRSDKFLPDPDLPADKAVTTQDYKGSGWDRGHLCPAGDNKWDREAMIESFYMTNICPQNHNLNRGDWKELEEACRRWAEQEGPIYIACGPIFYNRQPRTIGSKHKIAVPDAFFKVILCTGSRQPRAIGFIYKNTSGNRPLDSYVNSVDQVERITGIDFFPALPDDVEKKVEAEYDLKQWN